MIQLNFNKVKMLILTLNRHQCLDPDVHVPLRSLPRPSKGVGSHHREQSDSRSRDRATGDAKRSHSHGDVIEVRDSRSLDGALSHSVPLQDRRRVLPPAPAGAKQGSPSSPSSSASSNDSGNHSQERSGGHGKRGGLNSRSIREPTPDYDGASAVVDPGHAAHAIGSHRLDSAGGEHGGSSGIMEDDDEGEIDSGDSALQTRTKGKPDITTWNTRTSSFQPSK